MAPGVGVKSEWLLMLGALEMLIPSPLEDGIMSSSSSSDKVSTLVALLLYPSGE